MPRRDSLRLSASVSVYFVEWLGFEVIGLARDDQEFLFHVTDISICQKRNDFAQAWDVRFGSLADISQSSLHVRFTPESRHSSAPLGCPLCAINGHEVHGRTASLQHAYRD
jgi:hypothetical protein